MARNGSGTYSLPQPAFVSGTKISSSAMNSNLADIASALTQSVSADGQTPLTGPIQMPSGTVGNPGITFSADKTTGFYLPNAGQIGWAASGTQGATFNSDKSVSWAGGATWTGNVTYNGTATFNANTTVGATGLTINATSVTFNSTGLTSFWAGLASTVTMNLVFDGGGTAILTNKIVNLEIPFAGTITRWTLIADQSTTSTVDVYRANAALPTVGGKLTASAPPTLTTATYNSSASIGTWTTTLAARDVIQAIVTTNNNAIFLTLSLTISRTGS